MQRSIYNPLTTYRENSFSPIEESTPQTYTPPPTSSSSPIVDTESQWSDFNSQSSGNANSGMTSAEQKMAGEAAGATGNMIIDLGMGYLQMKETQKNKAQAKELAEQERQDKLKQDKINFSLKQRGKAQEEKAFQIQKIKEMNDMRYQRFIYNLQKNVENRKAMREKLNMLFSHTGANTTQQFFSQTGGK